MGACNNVRLIRLSLVLRFVLETSNSCRDLDLSFQDFGDSNEDLELVLGESIVDQLALKQKPAKSRLHDPDDIRLIVSQA